MLHSGCAVQNMGHVFMLHTFILQVHVTPGAQLGPCITVGVLPWFLHSGIKRSSAVRNSSAPGISAPGK